MSGGGSCPTLGQGGEFIPPQGQIPISLCIFQLHPWALPSLLAPISHPIPPAHTKQIEPALHLDFFQASLIAQGVTCTKPVPSNPTAATETLCLFPLFTQPGSFASRRADQDDPASLPHHPQDFPNFAAIWNHPKRLDRLFYLAASAGSDSLLPHLL